MTEGAYVEDEDSTYSNRFRKANNRLCTYPELRGVFGEISWPDDEELRENPIVIELWREGLYPTPSRWLPSLESGLERMGKQLSDEDTGKLHGELAGANSRVAKSKSFEILLYHHFDSRGFEVNPEPELEHGGKADLRITDHRPVYIEAKYSATSDLDRSIESVYRSAAEEIAAETAENTYLQFDVDTARLIWNSELDERASKRELVEQFESMPLERLLQQNPFLHVEDIQSMPNDWTLEDAVRDSITYNAATSLGEDYKAILDDPEYEGVLDSSVSAFNGPIIRVQRGQYSGKVVEFVSERSVPSSSADEQKRIFLNRIETAIRKKMDKNQRQPGQINVLVVGAGEWFARGYTQSGHSPMARGFRTELRERVRKTMDDQSVEELAGIAMLEYPPDNCLWVRNPHGSLSMLKEFRETDVYAHLADSLPG